MNALMNVSVPVTTDALADAMRSIPYEDLAKFLLEVDLLIADCGFTEMLVDGLVKSLKCDSEGINLPYIDWSKVKP